MSEVTVRSLAKVLNLPVEKLLEQLSQAGMQFTGPDQVVSSTEKMKLLGFLRRTHGKEEKPADEAGPKRITLQRRKVEEITVQIWERELAVHAKGVFLGTRTAIPAMRKGGGGSIINTSSVMGIVGSPTSPAIPQGEMSTLSSSVMVA